MRFGKSYSTRNITAILNSYLQLNKNELTKHEIECFTNAVSWCNNNSGITISQLLTVVRVVGGTIALRVDKPEQHWFIQYSDSRNRPVVVDPTADTRTPFEVSDIPSLWDDAEFSFVHRDSIHPKTVDSLSVVSHPDHKTRIVYGSYPDSVELIFDSTPVVFETKFTVDLPEVMTVSEVNEWIHDGGDSVSEFFDVVVKNEESGWGSVDVMEPNVSLAQ